MSAGFWRRCNTCKSEIGFARDYWVCSVSTCHRKGTDFAFCTVECWEAHVPLFRHRDAWAEQRSSPSSALAPTTSAAPRPAPAAGISRPSAPLPAAPSAPPPMRAPPPPAAPSPGGAGLAELPPLALCDRREIPEEILVVASKLKAYIRARSGMNTSDGVLPRLSEVLRDLCDDAIERAHRAGRKTVMDRDVP